MTVDDDLKLAAASWKKKDAAATVKSLEKALLQARAAAPLEIRVAVPINHDHTGIGLYTPAKDDTIDGRRVRIYLEVANFRTAALSPGVEHAQLDVTGDFTFEDPAKNGELLKLQSGVALGSQAFDTRTSLGVTSMGVDINLGEKSPAGVYHVTLRVKDAIGNQTATKDVRFVLR